jgi:hypothetical protein
MPAAAPELDWRGSTALNQTRKCLAAKFGSQHGIGGKDDQGRNSTSQYDPNDGEQELPHHGDLT